MLSRSDILELTPHQGPMCLLDCVLEWDTRSVLVSSASHRAADNPLRRDGRLAAIHLCEYGAQAMAVHGGLLARHAGQPAPAGMLVALRQVVFAIDSLESLQDDLLVRAERLHADRTSWQYAFVVTHARQQLATGRAAVMAPQET